MATAAAAARGAEAGAVGAAAGPSPWAEACGLLQLAMEQGFSRALAIRRDYVDGLVGSAEVQVELARLAERAGDAEGARGCWAAAVQVGAGTGGKSRRGVKKEGSCKRGGAWKGGSRKRGGS